MFLFLNDANSKASVIKPMLGATSGCTLLALHFLLFSPFLLSEERMQ